MTTEKRKTFTVIVNDKLIEKERTEENSVKHLAYQTNPLDMREKLMKFTNNEAGSRFTVEDLLKR